MKLTVIGGGGVRSMFLAKSLARKATSLGITELCFMDNNPKKLSIYGEMARKVASIIEPDLKFSLTTDAVEAVTDAD
ncbi:MAG: 6-phospho-beta-glucosidase, partial [Clostridia bacterium]|nr:6-phospho-beta-glucosidase [Clostridia bacterium]